jgi:hypothetical protein
MQPLEISLTLDAYGISKQQQLDRAGMHAHTAGVFDSTAMSAKINLGGYIS